MQCCLAAEALGPSCQLACAIMGQTANSKRMQEIKETYAFFKDMDDGGGIADMVVNFSDIFRTLDQSCSFTEVSKNITIEFTGNIFFFFLSSVGRN